MKIFNIFRRKKLSKNPEVQVHTVDEVSITDCVQNPTKIEVKSFGNSTLLTIRGDDKGILLDQERCVLLAAILNRYGETGQINDIAQLLKGEE